MRTARSGSGFSVIEGGHGVRLLLICAEGLTTAEHEAVASLPTSIAIECTGNTGTVALAELCRPHGCTLEDTAVIATRPQDLSLMLEARWAIALSGAGYENEAAADRVFPSRAAGGLVKAIRYVGSLQASA